MRTSLVRLMCAAIVCLSIALASGCASRPEIKSAVDALAVSEAVVHAVADTAGEAYRAGRITRAEAEQIAAVLTRVLEMQDEAEDLIRAGNEAGAKRTLEMARAALLAVEKELARRAKEADKASTEVAI
jgi:hypothetical protein